MRFKAVGMALVLFGFCIQSIWAIGISPAYQVFELKPGKKAKGELRLTNDTDQGMTVTPTTKEWFITPGNEDIKTDDWLKVDTEEFSLKPGESRIVKFRLKTPKKAKGELVSMISFHYEMEQASILKNVFSTAIYLGVVGTEKMSSKVEALTVKLSSRSVTAGVFLNNKGNIHLRPAGLIQLRNSEDKPVANIRIRRSRPTQPGQARPYYGTVNDIKMKPGRYTAHIDLKDADRDRQIYKGKKKFLITEEMEVRVK